MLFNSLEFLIFFPAVVFLYFFSPSKFRWIILLLASAVFYLSFIPVYLILLLAYVFITYFGAIVIEQSEGRKRRQIFIVSVALPLLMLFIFKYFNFFNISVSALAQVLHWNYSVESLSLILPAGISFYTFQVLSYIFEVNRGNQKAERHLGIYALYVMFFPQLLAGPIGRPGDLLPQFRQHHKFEYRRVTDGLKLMAWGFFKKVVLADRLTMYVDTVWSSPADFQGISYIVATVFFAFQMYCDFSGYSDIAIGAAQVLGIRLMENFNRPYHATSITEIWRRWHISLSSWIKDYLYTPLSVQLRDWGQAGVVCALLFSFTLIGLWHGANWTYIVYGFLHGSAISIEMLTRKLRKKWAKVLPGWIYNGLGYVYTMIFWCLTLIIFRSKNLSEGFHIITHLFSGVPGFIKMILSQIGSFGQGQGLLDPIFLGISKWEFVIVVAGILIMETGHLVQRHRPIRQILAVTPSWLRWAAYYLLIFTVLTCGVFIQEKPFIYFQF